jgi:hypothetical protein
MLTCFSRENNVILYRPPAIQKMGSNHSNQSSIEIHDLTQKEQHIKKSEHDPNRADEQNHAKTEFTTVYLITLTKKYSMAKRKLELNYSNGAQRWFICPSNNRMDQLIGGNQKPTREELEQMISDDFDRFFKKH